MEGGRNRRREGGTEWNDLYKHLCTQGESPTATSSYTTQTLPVMVSRTHKGDSGSVA